MRDAGCLVSEYVLGIDLGLSCTGVAIIDDGGEATTHAIRTKRSGRRRTTTTLTAARISHITARVGEIIDGNPGTCAAAVVEGPAYGAPGRHWTSAWLRGRVIEALLERHITPIEVSPKLLKKVVTGYGNAAKSAVRAGVVQRFGVDDVITYDEADALAAALIAADRAGICPDGIGVPHGG